MFALKDGWFSEVNDQWPGSAMSLEVEEVLHDEKSKYQHVQVFKSKSWGNVLILDDVIQATERDECAYQEMITHIPMFSHPNPKHVLVVGGGDGGVIREVLRHPSVEKVTICEIDQMVIDVSKKYLPHLAQAWGHPKVELHCGDANVYMQREENLGKYDVIVSDTSDPVGPAEALFELPFYLAMRNALRPGGVIGTQAESMWNNLDLIQRLVKETTPHFESVEYSTTQIPTYPCGQIGILVCKKAGGEGNAADAAKSCSVPVRNVSAEQKELFKYYTTRLHSAAFVLPAFLEQAIEKAKQEVAAAEEK